MIIIIRYNPLNQQWMWELRDGLERLMGTGDAPGYGAACDAALSAWVSHNA